MELIDKLLDKSKESFIMAIEIYNKPTIKYRVEGFALFICNAWELMLKAHLINTKGNDSIYFKDKPNRTISLEKCVKDVFTNDKDPLRLNLEKIIELRNTSTHFIVEEYEMIYIPLFQACVFNFIEKIYKFHKINISELMPSNFINLTINMNIFNEETIRAKYPEKLYQKLLKNKEKIDELSNNNNPSFAIRVEHYHYITKNRDNATSVISIDKSGKYSANIIKELKNPNETHKYKVKDCLYYIKEKLNKNGINININNYHFQNICKYYDLKKQEKFCFYHNASNRYTYSQAAIDFIINEIKNDPNNILEEIKKSLSKKNKLTHGAKEF